VPKSDNYMKEPLTPSDDIVQRIVNRLDGWANYLATVAQGIRTEAESK
jgi:hypothetical protein